MADFRVTHYLAKSSAFTGQTIDVTLDQDLLTDYFIIPIGWASVGNTAKEDRIPAEKFPRVSGDPFGDLETTTASDVIRLKRGASSPIGGMAFSFAVVECTSPSSTKGFRRRGTHELTIADNVVTPTTEAHSGVVDSDQCQVILGGFTSTWTNPYNNDRTIPRARHTATDVEIERLVSAGACTATLYLIEWGSDVTVQLVEFDEATSTVGDNLDTAAEWDTVAITSVTAAESWVTATFATNNEANPSRQPPGFTYILGNGVDLNTTESTIAFGSVRGGSTVKGWAYVVSCADSWYVERKIHAYGTVVSGTSSSFTTTPSADGITYVNDTNWEKASGTSLMLARSAAQAQSDPHGCNVLSAFIRTSDGNARFDREAVAGTDDDGLLVVEMVDFGGSPYGDEDDISSSLSSATVSRGLGVVAGHETVSSTVTVLDGSGVGVNAATVQIKDGYGAWLSGVTNTSGVVTISGIGCPDARALGLVVLMGSAPVTLSPSPVVAFVAPPRNYTNKLGANLGGIADFNATDPFIDLMLSARGANTSTRGVDPFHVQAKEDFDANGWQQSCTTTESVNYVISTEGAKKRPSGTYVCLYEGGSWAGFTPGQITMTGATSIVSNVAGRIEFTWDGVVNLYVTINPTSGDMTSANYVHSIQVLHEDDESTYDRSVNIWRQEYLDSLQHYTHLRFMQWGETNQSAVVNWSDRPDTNVATCALWLYDDDYPTVQRKLGVPVEWMLDLCNRLKCDAHICVPHRATDAYVTSLCTLVRDTLDAELRLHLEYTNEGWNFLFTQAAYIYVDLVAAYGIAGGDTHMKAYATRSAEVMNLASAVFAANPERLVRCMAGQSSNPAKATAILTTDVTVGTSLTGTAKDYCDAYHIAPYWGNAVEETTAAAALDAAELDLAAVIAPDTGEIAQNYTNVQAVDSTIKLYGYEGGQHLTPQGDQTEAVVTAANRLPDMRTDYYDYMVGWDREAVGGVMYMFAHISAPAHSGAWGLLESLDEFTNPAGAGNYKYYGWIDWLGSDSGAGDGAEVLSRSSGFAGIKMAAAGNGYSLEGVDTAYYQSASFLAVDSGVATNPTTSAELVIAGEAPGTGSYMDIAEDANNVKHRRMSIDSAGAVTEGFLVGPLPPKVRATFSGAGASGWDLYVILHREPGYDRGR